MAEWRATALALLALGLATAAGAEALAQRPVELPMRFYGARPAVEVRVNGQGPFLFLIDTGAAGVARADVGLVKRLGLTRGGRALAADRGGRPAAVDTIDLATLEVGPIALAGVTAISRDYNAGAPYLAPIDGILGLGAFEGVLMTLDFRRATVRLERGALPPADGKTILGYRLEGGNPVIPIRIGDRRLEALLDTGDSRAIDLPSAWLRPFRLASFARTVGSSRSVSGEAPLKEAAIRESLWIGGSEVKAPAVTFSDDFDGANLGAALLQDFTITIDQKNRRVRLVRRPLVGK